MRERKNVFISSALFTTAIGFAVLNGANNGSTLVAIATTSTSLLPITAITLLATALVVGPLLFGTFVATNLSARLLEATGRVGELTFLVGILAAMAVIALLAWKGLPSSLTLATIGGLEGAGIASGIPMNWTIGILAIVLAVAVPFSTGALTFAILRSLNNPFSNQFQHNYGHRRAKWFRYGSFGLQSLAYAANDGQRMLAVLFVAIHSAPNTLVYPTFVLYIAVAGAFAIGTVFGTARMANGTPNQLTLADSFERSLSSVIASLAAFGSSLLGVPVSMTQTTGIALVGAHGTRGMRRIRWEEVSKLFRAWIITLPSSAILGAGTVLILGWRK